MMWRRDEIEPKLQSSSPPLQFNMCNCRKATNGREVVPLAGLAQQLITERFVRSQHEDNSAEKTVGTKQSA